MLYPLQLISGAFPTSHHHLADHVYLGLRKRNTLAIDWDWDAPTMIKKLTELLKNHEQASSVVEDEGQYEAYDYAKDLFFNLLQKEEVAFPDFVVFVACEPEDYAKRQSREISVGLLRTKEAQDFFTKEYEKICVIFERYGRLQKLISKDGKQSLEQNRKLMTELKINSLSEDDKQQIITEIMETI